jgi:ABC-2 type transport system ATP-binding protein
MTAASPDAPALLATALVKRYGTVLAINDVSFALAQGEFVGLLGPNGAGKTTLLSLLTGLFTADEGTIHVGDVELARDGARALAQLGVVFQQPALDLDLSVQANLHFHADLHGLTRTSARARSDALLAALGIAEHRHTPTRTLSGGNRRKVELARALLHAPRVLLMDEATVGLDPQSRAQLLTLVRALCAAHGVAVLWATHLVDEVALAQRVLVLAKGRIAFDGSPTALAQRSESGTVESGFLALTQRAPSTVKE